ncbi:type IX secretion system PorP/SprF family membrane protein [Aquimarina sp. MAR_2010_214]|uniref:PorP/SprF family type IX secretion system membrane protein n=2 Tax=Aquimarina TaxID=290174 RepID=UPI000C70744E|nr:PorP/SprF family type IX secretion system membrane protein [Aquimarina sp. MAR_2010_214]PKV48747.1 type IX secretion system PorP/SprF family membrane protein [Aquimarina sp. MAR_2010_214]
MVRKLLLIIICISFNLLRGQDENTTTYGVLPTDIPTHNLVKYNRFYFNPTFSLVRENKKSVNVYNKTQWASFNDNPQTYLINYTANFDEKIGVSIGLHQQNEGIYRYFGGIANFAYNVELNRDMNFTFGVNLGFSQSGIKSNIDSATSTVLNNGVEISDPVILNYEKSSVFQLTPGVNFNYEEFDVGVSVSNLVAYNLTSSELLTDNMAFTGHVMYTTSLQRRSDKIIRGIGYANMLPDSGTDTSNLRYGGSVIVELPALGWAQAGYNSFYGASLGIGGNITSNVSVGYTYETGLGDTSNFGATHEVGLAYNFEKEKPRRRRRGSRTKSSTQKAYEERDSEIRRLKKEILEQNKLIRNLQNEKGDSRSQDQKAMNELERSIAEAKEKEAKAARELELQREEEVKLLNKKAEEERLAAQRQIEREVSEQKTEEERLAAQRRIEREVSEQKAEEERLAAQRRIEREVSEQKAEEERLAAQRRIEREVSEQKAEEERIATEEAAREAEAAEQERIVAQKELDRELAEQKAEEERLIAQKQLEREVSEQKVEEERLATQKRLEREVAEQKIADEATEVARLAEEKRLADEAAAEAARLAEEKRLADEAAAEAARLAEEKRLADEAAAEAARLAEEKRLADEAAAEAARLAEEKRLADEAAAEAARLAEEKRLADEAAAEVARLAEEKRLADEAAAEAARLAEEKRLADEAAAEAARLAEEKRLADEAAAEVARLAEEKRLADEAAAEVARLAEEKRLADEAAAEVARLAEEKRLADEAAAEAARLAEAERLRQEAAATTKNEEGLDEIKKELDNSSRITSKIFARRDSLLTTSLNVDKREFSKLLESLVSMNDDADEAKREADPTSSKRLTAKNRFVKFAETTRPEAQIATKFIPGYPEGYYLIGNVFKGGAYADKFTGTLKDLGFNDSKIILNPENQFQYVAIESYANRDEATEKYLNNIDNRYFGDMWILHIAKSRVESYKKLLQETRLIKDTVKDDTVLAESLSYIGGHNIENGYYLITNIFKRENYFERGMAKLRSQGLEPQYFRNPKDNYIYVYLKRYDNLDEAKQSLFSNVNNSYDGELYILKIQ